MRRDNNDAVSMLGGLPTRDKSQQRNRSQRHDADENDLNRRYETAAEDGSSGDSTSDIGGGGVATPSGASRAAARRQPLSRCSILLSCIF